MEQTQPMQPVETLDAGWGINFEEIYHALRERVWLIVACALIGSLLGAMYCWFAPKLYWSRTTIQVDSSQRKVVNLEGVTQEDLSNLDTLKTIEQSLASRTMLWNTYNALNMTPKDLGLRERKQPYSEKEILDRFEWWVQVKLVRGTRLITIDAEAQDRVLAKQISEMLVNQYIRSNMEQRLEIAKQATGFLVEEAERLRVKAEKAEQSLQEYKEKNQAVSLDDSQNIVLDDLKNLNQKLTTARSERLKLEADFGQVQKLGKKSAQDLLAIASVANSPSVVEIKKRVAEQEGQLANLNQRYLPKHPKYIQAQSELKELQDALGRAAIVAADSLGTAFNSAKDAEQKFEQALKEREQKLLELNKIAIPYNTLAREVQSSRAMYDAVLTRLKETDVTKNVDQVNFRVVEPPFVADKWILPKVKVDVILTLIGGLVAGVGIAFVLNAMDNSFKTVDQAERILALPAIGAVPKVEETMEGKDLLILREPHGAVAEAFRTLRTSLSLLGGDNEKRVFLFTSAVPGEGKSFSSVNYAVSLAQQGLRTLLVDADLRLPTIAKKLFDNGVHPGLSDIIAKQIRLEECVRNHEIENLSVVTAGNRAPNPAELLSGKGFGEFVQQALLKYDRIVIDSAPVHAVADTLLLIKYVHATCLVVHSGKTPRRAVARAVMKLAEAGSRPVGFILNRLPPHGGASYYYYYSAGEYGKGVYGAPANA